MAFDLGAQQRHEVAELLHMRLAGGIGQRRHALGQRGAEHEVLGGGDRGVIGPVVIALQRPVHGEHQAVGQALDCGAEALEHLHMRVDLARAQRAALDVVLDARRAEAGHQPGHQHDGRAHLLGQPVGGRVEVGVRVVHVEDAGLEIQLDAGAEPAEDLDDLLHVGDLGHAAQAHRLLGQQRGAEDGQDGVLVGRGDDAAGEGRAAVDDQVGHRMRESVRASGARCDCRGLSCGRSAGGRKLCSGPGLQSSAPGSRRRARASRQASAGSVNTCSAVVPVSRA